MNCPICNERIVAKVDGATTSYQFLFQCTSCDKMFGFIMTFDPGIGLTTIKNLLNQALDHTWARIAREATGG